MQAVSLKVGNLYGPEYVNELYNQLLTFEKSCVYYCMTDNAKGLNKDIRILPITDDYKDRKWWNKTKLFEPGLFKEPTLYMDLDCYIHKDPTPFIDTANLDKLNVLKTYWFFEEIAKVIHQCAVNTSVMVITENNSEPLWRDCKDNMEKMYKSFYGLDPWLYRRHKENINYFNPGLAYSYKHGCHYPDDIEKNTIRQLPICIFDDAQDRKEIINGLWRSSEAMG